MFKDCIDMIPETWQCELLAENVWHVQMDEEDEHTSLVYYDLSPSVMLIDIDLNCQNFPVLADGSTKLFTINHCLQGRCEASSPVFGSTVVDGGLACISSNNAQTFSYPTGRYRGFEYVVVVDEMDSETEHLLDSFSIDLHLIDEKLCKQVFALTIRPVGALELALRASWNQIASGEMRTARLLLSFCQVLACLDGIDAESNGLRSTYLQRSQREMARRLHGAICANPQNPPNVGEFAKESCVSEVSLRSYFQRVYGESPTSFARSLVMKDAARLLAEGKLAIGDVSLASGYSNPSKFSAAFKRVYGVNPLEYRRQFNAIMGQEPSVRLKTDEHQ